MSETELFLSLLVDDDGIVTSQKALTPAEAQLAVCAAPSTVSYVTCGTGSNVEATSVPISTWGQSDFTANSNVFYLSAVEAKKLVTGTLISDNVTTSAYSFEVGSTSACPIPNPYAYAQLDSDGTDSGSETNVGAGATVTNKVSNSDHITWNDTDKQFNVSGGGTYECVGVIILEGGSALVTLTVRKSGVDVLAGVPRVHATVDPLEHTIRAVFDCSPGDTVDITYDAAANTVKAITGSTMTVKRLK